jgi:hypothetical protein
LKKVYFSVSSLPSHCLVFLWYKFSFELVKEYIS